jgi:hypothetical protein
MNLVVGVLGRTVLADILRSEPGAGLDDKVRDRVKGAPGFIRHMLLLPWREREDFAASARAAAGPAARHRREINIAKMIFGSFPATMLLPVFLVLIYGLPALPRCLAGKAHGPEADI